MRSALLYPPAAGTHVGQLIVRFGAPMDFHRFQHAWQAAVGQFPRLFSGIYQNSQGTLVQCPPDKDADLWAIEFKDWQTHTRAETDEYLDMLVSAYQRNTFSLSSPPLFRIVLIQTDKDSAICVWTFHQAVADRHTLVSVFSACLWVYAGSPLPPVSTRPELPAPPSCPHARHRYEALFKGYRQRACLPVKPRAVAQAPAEKRRHAFLPLTTAAETLCLDRRTTQQMASVAQGCQVPFSVLMLGVWTALLAHFSGVTDILLGVRLFSASDKTTPEDAFFPVRTILCPKQPFKAYLKELQALPGRSLITGQMAEPHPFQQLIPFTSDTAPETVFTYGPSFRAALAPLPETAPAITHAALTERLPYPLALTIAHADGLGISIHYDRRQFGTELIKTLLGHYSRLLTTSETFTRLPLAHIPFLSDAEKQDLLRNQNPSFKMDRQGGCVHHLFDIQAMAAPDAIAVSTDKNGILYGELSILTNQIAHFLIRQGLGPGQTAVLTMGQGIPLAAFALGIMKAGAAYLHLDPDMPEPDLHPVLKEAGPSFVICQTIRKAFTGSGAKVLTAGNQTLTQIKKMPAGAPDQSRTGPKDRALYRYQKDPEDQIRLYWLTHQALASHSVAANTVYDLQQGDILCLDVSPASGDSLEAVYPALVSGASILFPPEIIPPAALIAFCQKAGPTVLRLPGHAWNPPVETGRLPDTLRLAVLTGGQILAGQSATWQKSMPNHARLINVFGPFPEFLESFYSEPRNRPRSESPVFPFPGVQVAILNPFGQPVLPQGQGRLFLKPRWQTTEDPGVSPARTCLEVNNQTAPFYDTGWEARSSHESGLIIRTGELSGKTAVLGDPSPIILIGHSMTSARAYKQADRNGHPFFHAPIFIHLYGQERGQALSMDVQQIARECVREITDRFPSGPYILIGSCQNAVVAHEATAQLNRMNHEVQNLIIIDENWNARSAPPPDVPQGLISRMTGPRAGVSGVMKTVAEKIRKRLRTWYIAMDETRESLAALMGKRPPVDVQFRLMESLFYRICDAHPYTPAPYDGNVILLYSRNWKTDFHPQLHTFYTGRVKVKEVDINHSQWFEPDQIRLILDLIKARGTAQG